MRSHILVYNRASKNARELRALCDRIKIYQENQHMKEKVEKIINREAGPE
jgi:hypothetical protein